MANKYCYRIYTEDCKENSGIDMLCSSYGFSSFTAFRSIGYWLGTAELSLCIEIIGDASDKEATKELASAIMTLGKQSAVYWIGFPVESELIVSTKVTL